ncbi:MAG: 3-deoxy-manno-octulosonate cytidylyltransferase [Candidatus Paceibacterota bacterium]
MLYSLTYYMKKEKILGVIPARLGSTRLKRKMLVDINGKPLIYHTWKQAKKAKMLDEVVVATDSKEIFDVVEDFGGKAIMTPKSIKTGSDRVAKTVERFKDFAPTIVINIQGDEPMMPPSAINKTAELLAKDKKALMSTVATPLKEKRDLDDPGVVKVVRDKEGYALYFSRSIIPYARTPYTAYLKHMGIYGYRPEFLKKYVSLKQTPLERAELLEQLRALENGVRIKVGVGKYDRAEVNTPEELAHVRKLMRKKS